MVLNILGEDYSGKTSIACKYAASRQPVLIFDFDKSFVLDFHGKNLQNPMIASCNTMLEADTIVKSFDSFKSIIIDSLSSAGTTTDKNEVFDSLSSIIDHCNEKGIDLYVIQRIYKTDDYYHNIGDIQTQIEQHPTQRKLAYS